MSAWVGNRLGSAVSWQQWRGGEWGWHGGPLTVSSDHSPLWRTFPEYLMNNISFYSQALSSGEQTNNLNHGAVCNLTGAHFISFSVSRFPLPLPQRHGVWPAAPRLHKLVRGWLPRAAGGESVNTGLENITSALRRNLVSCAWKFLWFPPLFWTRSDKFFFPIGFNVVFFNWFYLCT